MSEKYQLFFLGGGVFILDRFTRRNPWAQSSSVTKLAIARVVNYQDSSRKLGCMATLATAQILFHTLHKAVWTFLMLNNV